MKVQSNETPEISKTYGVKAHPSLVLAEADGKAITTKVGASGIMTPATFNTWLDLQLEGAATLPKLLEEAKDSTDPDLLIKVAEKLVALEQLEEAARMFGRAEKLLVERTLNVKLQRAGLLLRGNKDSTDLRAVMDDLLPSLIEAKDERIVDLAFKYCNIFARLGTVEKNNPERARQVMLDMQTAFPEHGQVRAMRNSAAMYAHLGGDDETALAEMKAMIADDEANEVDDPYTKRARAFVARLEKGERYR